ncbi:Serine/threonine-protein kinase BRI1-like 1 [Acorus calamus]|uniref:Serine/threonine-protein kinase BRI1-like 1 n=1 Tax=Acorus calamus TaxID=4465 RepID=A0AAV9C3A1_ACOCL|nr:Serine/threonine-protein kinase BRI1-like 1 [Acorus calamus]
MSSSAVLLDEDYEARITDFGIARLSRWGAAESNGVGDAGAVSNALIDGDLGGGSWLCATGVCEQSCFDCKGGCVCFWCCFVGAGDRAEDCMCFLYLSPFMHICILW